MRARAAELSRITAGYQHVEQPCCFQRDDKAGGMVDARRPLLQESNEAYHCHKGILQTSNRQKRNVEHLAYDPSGLVARPVWASVLSKAAASHDSHAQAHTVLWPPIIARTARN